jgi:hypothetical protein
MLVEYLQPHVNATSPLLAILFAHVNLLAHKEWAHTTEDPHVAPDLLQLVVEDTSEIHLAFQCKQQPLILSPPLALDLLSASHVILCSAAYNR